MYNKKEVIHMFNLIVGIILVGAFMYNEYKYEGGTYSVIGLALLFVWLVNLGYGIWELL